MSSQGDLTRELDSCRSFAESWIVAALSLRRAVRLVQPVTSHTDIEPRDAEDLFRALWVLLFLRSNVM